MARDIRDRHDAGDLGQGCGLTNALLPFLCDDPDMAVVATAARAYALHRPLERDNPLTGAGAILSLAERVGEPERTGAMLGGLLAIGDRRVVELVDPVFDQLEPQPRQIAMEVVPHPARAAVIEWWVQRLEQDLATLGDVSPEIVMALARTGRALRESGQPVDEVHVVFPVHALPAQLVLPRLEHRFDVFAGRVVPRLDAVAAREPEPRIVPVALEAWGRVTTGPHGLQ